MKTQYQLARAAACLLLTASSVHVHAQTAADPQAAVPATSYQSSLGKPAEATPSATPDANWVKSNETVAATNSMALTMKPRASQAADPHAGHAMQGMNMDKKDSPSMCTPGGDKGEGKMSCCGSGCESCCCKDKMKKKEAA